APAPPTSTHQNVDLTESSRNSRRRSYWGGGSDAGVCADARSGAHTKNADASSGGNTVTARNLTTSGHVREASAAHLDTPDRHRRPASRTFWSDRGGAGASIRESVRSRVPSRAS